MKALVLVDHAVGTSGPHRNVVGSLNALAARGDLSVRLLTGAIDEAEPYARSSNLEIRLGFQPHSVARLAGNYREICRAARGCDVVYIPTNLKSLLYGQLVRRGRRLVAGPNVTPLPIRRADSPGWPELAWMCDLWLEASNAKRDYVAAHAGYRNIQCIRHSINTESFDPARRSAATWGRHGISPESTKVLYVGRDNEPRKGVAQLLDAIDSIHRTGQGPGIDFVLAGPMSEMTARRAASMPNVHLLGFVGGTELAAIYASSDICVVPSSWENMPFTVLEAMASGLAVVASRTGGIPEQIVADESGVLVHLVGPNGRHRADAGETLALAIAGLAADPDRRAQLGQNARKHVIAHFSELRLGEELVNAFRQSSPQAG